MPRGLGRSGPVILSYGFRPFFLGAGLWGALAMALWIAALASGWEIGGSYGRVQWHAHEMLFGYTSAALAGFLLTAVPNWTGRLPVSGRPLAVLFSLWLAGRLALLAPDLTGLTAAASIDAVFLPVLLAVCAREIVAGKKWNNLKIVVGLAALAVANIAFHVSTLTGAPVDLPGRAAVAIYVILILIMGGRLIPSFSRNWLVKAGAPRLPAPNGRFDTVAIAAAGIALVCWIGSPAATATGVLALGAAALNLARLLRWRGLDCRREPLVAVLHVAYGFCVLGLAGVGAAAFGWFEPVAAMHILTVGAIGTMTLAVMTRASRGHTGMPLHASARTVVAYGAMVAAAVLRPLSWVFADASMSLLEAAGGAWILAFVLFSLEYGPVLLQRKPTGG